MNLLGIAVEWSDWCCSLTFAIFVLAFHVTPDDEANKKHGESIVMTPRLKL